MKSYLLLSPVSATLPTVQRMPVLLTFAEQCLSHLQNQDSAITDDLKVGIFCLAPDIPLTEKINLTYCFTTRFPASRADWKEQKLAKDSLKTEFKSLQQLLLCSSFPPMKLKNGACINENISRLVNTCSVSLPARTKEVWLQSLAVGSKSIFIFLNSVYLHLLYKKANWVFL